MLTDVGKMVESEIGDSLRGIFKKLIKLGYSPREISHVTISTVNKMESELIESCNVEVESESPKSRSNSKNLSSGK